MREAIVTVRDEDGTALGLEEFMAVFEEGGLRDLEVMSCEGSQGVVRVETDSAIDEDRLTDIPAVTWWERIAKPGPHVGYLLGFDVDEAQTMIDACSEDLILCGTIDVGDGDFLFDIAGPQDAIAETVAAYNAAGATVTLDALQDFTPGDEPFEMLTDRQQEVMQTAFDIGYFEVPRAATTEEIAAELDLDTSTVAEHLQRAERNLLSSLLTPSRVES